MAAAFACSIPTFGASKVGGDFAGLRRKNVVDTVRQPKASKKAQPKFEAAATIEASVAPRKVLVIGGTRFSGVYLVKALQEAGHEVTVFNRGKRGVQKVWSESDAEFKERASKIKTIVGDRTDPESLKQLAKEEFDVIYDNNGRELTDTKPLADMFKGRLEHFVYMSSAGTYLMNDSSLPYRESDPTDPKSRHKGKAETEAFLKESGQPWTSIRPVYIYGPQNYNDVEQWFFHRIHAGRPQICVPGHGQHLTGLGHVEDLAVAMANVIGNKKAVGQIYNIQGDRCVTFDGLVKACAEAAGKPCPEIVHYNPKDFDFGKKKAFPFRQQHFFASIQKAEDELNWSPKYDLVAGLRDSYENDYVHRTVALDFETDDIILGK
eukprot:tig00021181_g19317.t1